MHWSIAEWRRAYTRRYPGPIGIFIALLAFEIVTYSQRYVTGELDGVPVPVAVGMHLSRVAMLVLFLTRPLALPAYAGWVYAVIVPQILVMSSFADNSETTVYLVAIISGLSVLFASFCPVRHGVVIAAVSGLSVAVAVYPSEVSAGQAATQSLFVGAIFAASPSAVVWFRHRLRQARARAETLADTDALTGLLNRRGLIAQLSDLVGEAQQRGSEVVAMAMDLDHFKTVNDAHGHSVGDRVLTDAARAVQGCLREGDVVGRMGGEEFVALLATSPRRALELAECVRRSVPEATSPHGVTVSIGVAAATVPSGSLVDPVDWVLRLIDEADALLYLAKESGRDQIRNG